MRRHSRKEAHISDCYLCKILKSHTTESVHSEALSGELFLEVDVPGDACVKVSETERKGFSLLFLM